MADGNRVVDGGVQVDSGGIDYFCVACPNLPSLFVDVMALVDGEGSVRSMLDQMEPVLFGMSVHVDVESCFAWQGRHWSVLVLMAVDVFWNPVNWTFLFESPDGRNQVIVALFGVWEEVRVGGSPGRGHSMPSRCRTPCALIPS